VSNTSFLKLKDNEQISLNEISHKDNDELFGIRIINITTLMTAFPILCCPESFTKE
jgi:hypothetical protein